MDSSKAVWLSIQVGGFAVLFLQEMKLRALAQRTKKLFCFGNPLLDISSDVPKEFLEKYGLKLDNAVMAEPKHLPIFQELVQKYKPTFVAGGATQNTARVAQWQAGVAGAVSYTGGIGKDKFGETLEKEARRDGLNTIYYKDNSAPTGTCAVLINGGERSLVANLGAAEKYNIAWTKSPPVHKAISEADYFYASGFVLTHSLDTILHVAEHFRDTNKTFMVNTAAPFLFEVPPFLKAFQEVWEYIDVLVGNESEAEAVGKAFKFSETDIGAIAQKIARMPKKNAAKPRMVVFTQGSKFTVVATPEKLLTFPVNKVAKVVDTNGAGDSFCGGFFAGLIQGRSIEECVAAGQHCSGVVIQRSGCQFSDGSPYSWGTRKWTQAAIN